MTPIEVERKHGGHGAIFQIDGTRYYTATCCMRSEVEITDEDARQCVTVCERHGRTQRTYAAALTDDRRAQLDRQFCSSGDFNPVSDPHGDRQQRRRESGYTTHAWHRARS